MKIVPISIAYQKVAKTIASCKTQKQVDAAWQMAIYYNNIYHDSNGLLTLRNSCIKQYTATFLY